MPPPRASLPEPATYLLGMMPLASQNRPAVSRNGAENAPAKLESMSSLEGNGCT